MTPLYSFGPFLLDINNSLLPMALKHFSVVLRLIVKNNPKLVWLCYTIHNTYNDMQSSNTHQLRNRSIITTRLVYFIRDRFSFHPVYQRSADQGTTTFLPPLIALVVPLEATSPKTSCSPWSIIIFVFYFNWVLMAVL